MGPRVLEPAGRPFFCFERRTLAFVQDNATRKCPDQDENDRQTQRAHVTALAARKNSKTQRLCWQQETPYLMRRPLLSSAVACASNAAPPKGDYSSDEDLASFGFAREARRV